MHDDELSRRRELGVDTVAITDIDCTPRPRRGESWAAFEQRLASYGSETAALRRWANAENRRDSLRTGAGADGHKFYFTQCACRWHGLRHSDPELARREFDAHACAAESIGDDAVSRAQAHAGRATMPAKRKAAVLQPALGGSADEDRVVRRDVTVEEAERFALLEPKP